MGSSGREDGNTKLKNGGMSNLVDIQATERERERERERRERERERERESWVGKGGGIEGIERKALLKKRRLFHSRGHPQFHLLVHHSCVKERKVFLFFF